MKSSFLRITVAPGVTKERLDEAKYNLYQSGLIFLETVRKGKGRQNGTG